jgi:hypothetical protein
MAETVFGQDLNGDGHVGLKSTLIASAAGAFGTTQLTQIGDFYYLNGAGGVAGPQLKLNGAPIGADALGGWTAVGAVATAGGYEMAFKLTGTNLFTLWNVDANGNFVSDTVGAVAGTSTALEAAETTFNLDLNGDRTVGIPTVVISTDGSTQLTQVGNTYFLYAVGGTSGPALKINGVAVVAGTLGGWAPMGAVAAAGGGYEVAFQLAGTNMFTLWNVGADGNFVSDTVGAVTGTSTVMEAAETRFNQDLNGDHTVGIPTVLISTDGSTQLTQVGTNYFLYGTGGTSGPVLKINGVAVVAGTLGGWAPIGAVQTTGGYQVAFKFAGTNLFTLWNVGADGNYVSDTIGAVAGTSTAIETAESTFNQDLNTDGVVGLYAAPGTTLQITQALAGAATIGAGATLELSAADSGSVTFAGTTGTLIIDHAASFTGQLINLTGTGNLATSDVIDLKDVAFASASQLPYSGNTSGGTLTVKDGSGHTANLALMGDYTTHTFTLSNDGQGGTRVIDPPAAAGLAAVTIAGEATVGVRSGDAQPMTSATLMPAAAAAAAPAIAQLSVGVQAGGPIQSDALIPAMSGQPAAMPAVSLPAVTRPDVAAQTVAATAGGAAMPPSRTAPATATARSTGIMVDGGTAAGVAREIVSANDIIRAIRTSDIAIRSGEAPAGAAVQVWLFDDAQGTFVAADPEPFTIRLERDGSDTKDGRGPRHSVSATTEDALNDAWALAVAAPTIAAESSFFGTLRQFGRKAARVVQQGTRWMS